METQPAVSIDRQRSTLQKIVAFFRKVVSALVGVRDEVVKALDLALAALPSAFPFVEMVATLTPTQWDDAALAGIRAAYPGFFNPDLTADERKLYLLAVASELLRAKLPGISVTVARIAVQIAYLCHKLGAWISAKE